MTIVSHADPRVLEGELLDRIAREKARDPLAPLLVVVPTTRLADHVARRVADRLGAAVGIDILTLRALAMRILSASGRAARVADPSVEDALLHRVIDRAPHGRVRDFVRDRPVARPALLGTLSDLRDAGVEPAALPPSEVRELYARWAGAWDELAAERHLHDEAGLAVAATPHAPRFAARYAAILHHGAYELIGVHDDLVRALGAGRDGVTLRPAIADGALPDLTAKSVTFTDVQGARPELTRAAAAVLARIADGALPHEQAIVVRAFGPFASSVEALLLQEGLRWHTSFASSLRREPAVAAAVAGIVGGSERGPARWSAHADAISASLGGAGDDATSQLAAILDAMRSLEADLGDTRAIPAREADAFLQARIDAATVPPTGHDGGGPRLLDAMQARGMTFEHVAIVGMNSGLWPRVPREDPFLSDETRRRVRAATGRPIPLRLDVDAEERLLLAMTLGAARSSIDVSWRRADDHGRPLVPSLALREIERVSRPGRRSLPAHPRSRLETLARDPAVLRPEDEVVLVALAADAGANAAPAVRSRRPELAAGLVWAAATDAFDPRDLAFDGRVGASPEPRALSVSALETLARCPLQFFFEHRLGIEPVDRVESPYEPSRSKLGILVHDALREVYERLLAEGRFDEPGLLARVERARELVRQAWEARAPDFAAARARPLPVVNRVESELWRRALEEFVSEDLAHLESEGARPVALETRRRSADRVPDLPPMTARLDRIVEGPGGRVVGDYKIGGRLEGKVRASSMLKGSDLQVAVYALLEGTAVELLGAGRDHAVRRARFEGFGDDDVRVGVVETVRVVARLDETGTYPIRPDSHCAWCAFRSACRRLHPPSVFRGERAPDARDFRDLAGKSTKRPTLAAVRAGAEP